MRIASSDEKIVFTSIGLPADLHARTKNVASRLTVAWRHFVIEALSEKVDYFEGKFRAEKERHLAQVQEKKAEKRRARGIGKSKLAPKDIDAPKGDEEQETEDALAPLYDEHAQKISEAITRGSQMEKRLRLAEAVQAVKKRAPLTHPPEREIVRRLEAAVVANLDAQHADEERREKQALVVDPKRIATRGDVE